MTIRQPDPAFDAWIAEAKAVAVSEAVAAMGTLKRIGRQLEGPCPACGGRTRLWIDRAKDKWGCRHCQTGGRGALSLLMHMPGAQFLEVCEQLAGPPPRRLAAQTPEQRQAAERARAEAAAKRKADDERRAAEDEADRARRRERALRIWGAAQAIAPGDPVTRYLKLRGLAGAAFDRDEVGSIGLLDYYTEGARLVGAWPAMIWAVRDGMGAITAVHQTWLHEHLRWDDRQQGGPRDEVALMRAKGKAIISDPLSGERLKAKKMTGEAWGCAIRLTPARPFMLVGEGVETTLTALLSFGGRADVGAWSGLSLGGMAALELPEGTRAVTFLGDGDSEPAITRRTLEQAAAKAAASGIRARIAMAPQGRDFNDLVMP
jgi:hypothetical protein